MAAKALDIGMKNWRITSEGTYWPERESLLEEVYIEWDWYSDNFYSGWVNSSLLEACPSNWIVA